MRYADNRDDTQKYHDAQKLEERRKKEAYLLTREAHYQEEQQRLTRIKEVEESEAVTKLLLQAKLAPTPQTAGGRLRTHSCTVTKKQNGQSKGHDWQESMPLLFLVQYSSCTLVLPCMHIKAKEACSASHDSIVQL